MSVGIIIKESEDVCPATNMEHVDKFYYQNLSPPPISIVCLAKNGDHHSRRAEFVLRAKAVELDFYDYLGFYLIGEGQ